MANWPQVIYCDIDGVLADFVGGVLDLFGAEEVLDCWPKGQYEALPRLLGVPDVEMWKAIEAEGPGWWASLPPFHWSGDLLKALQEVAPVYLVTDCRSIPDVAAGKLIWIERECRGWKRRVIMLNGCRELLAHPGAVLIDDCPANVSRFIEMGGEGILFPQPWNYGDCAVDGAITSPCAAVLWRLARMMEQRESGGDDLTAILAVN